MDIYVIIVLLCLLLSIIMIFIPLKLQSKIISIAFKMLLGFGMIKYISLLIFYNADSPKNIYDIRYLPLLALVSIFILGYIMICVIGERKLQILDYVIILAMLFLGAYIAYNIPFGITNSELGYILVKNTKWLFVAFIYTVLVGVALNAISLKGFFKTKFIKDKACYLMISLSFISVMVEEGMAIMNKELFQFSVVGDLIVLIMFIFIAILKIKSKKER